MVLEPDTQQNIYERIRDAIAAASNITNFSPNSPEKAITDEGFSAEMRERQHEELAVQLSTYIDYAGKEITEQDLDDLGIDTENVDLDLLNSFIEDSDLDKLVKRYSIFRDPGAFATGTVTFQTSSEEVVIPDGTEVGTQPDADGDYLSFFTTKEVVSAQGSTSVDAPIQAANRGTVYNVGSGTITYLPESVPGVGGDPPVNNANATTGGEDEETNSELRQRAKEQLVGTSGGGTLQGVENGLVAAFAGLDEENVEIVEYPNQDPVTFDYVVDGGPSDQELRNEMDTLRPVAIEGALVRPTQVTIDLSIDVKGKSIDTVAVEEDLRSYINNLGLGDKYIVDKVIQTTMNADDGIDSISTLTTTIKDETIALAGELIDDFEDNDINIEEADWSGWSGATGALTAQNTTVLQGSYSAELAAANASNSVSATRSATGSNAAQLQVQLDNQTTNSGDAVTIEFLSGGTTLGYLEFDGAGNIDWYNGASTNITTWSANTTYVPFLNFDFANDQVEITVNGTTSTLALQNTASGFDEISITNDTTSSTGTVNLYFDQVRQYNPVYALNKGGQMASDGIVGVDDASGDIYTEDTDFAEIDTDGDGADDGIEWLGGGVEPDVGEDFYVDYETGDDVDIPFGTREKPVPGTVSVQVV